MSNSKEWHKHKDGVWHRVNKARKPDCAKCLSKNVDCAVGEDNKPVVLADDAGKRFCFIKCDFYENAKFGLPTMGGMEAN